MSEYPGHQPGIASPPISLTLVLLLGVLGLYLAATHRRRRSMRPWSGWRSASFAAGIAVLALALSPPLAALAHHDFRGHVVQHLLIGMVAPLGLVLGAPIKLLLRALPVAAGRGVVGLLRSRPVWWLSHPATALLLSTGGMYLLYLTPLYPAIMAHPSLHQILNLHFLAAGLLFTAAMVGLDPMPHRPSLWARLAVLFIAIAAHTTLCKLMYAYHWPRTPLHDLAEVRAGAQLMSYGGDVAELLLLIALFATWYARRGLAPAKRAARQTLRPRSS